MRVNGGIAEGSETAVFGYNKYRWYRRFFFLFKTDIRPDIFGENVSTMSLKYEKQKRSKIGFSTDYPVNFNIDAGFSILNIVGTGFFYFYR